LYIFEKHSFVYIMLWIVPAFPHLVQQFLKVRWYSDSPMKVVASGKMIAK
jgi:hypothetical protein